MATSNSQRINVAGGGDQEEYPKQEAEDHVETKKLDAKTDEDCGEQLRAAAWPEVVFYLVCFAAAFAYAAWDFYLAFGRDPMQALGDRFIKPGWLADWMEPAGQLDRQLLENYKFLTGSFLGFVLVSQLTLRTAPRNIHYLATATYTLAMTAVVVNIRSALYMLLLHIGAVCMAYFSLTGVWALVLSAMMMQNSTFQDQFVDDVICVTGIGRTLHYPIIGYLYCRSISAGHSLNRTLAQQSTSGAGAPTLMQFLRQQLPRALAYGFYYPWHYCGPILTLDDFCKEAERPERASLDARTVASLVWRVLRLLLWLFVLQALHHFLPVGAFLRSIEDGASVPYKRLAFSMYLHGHYFMMSYVQFYGWPGVVARLDGVQLLHWPDCISRVYTYKQMWRVFDRGLASFMHHHIYIPMGGSRHGPVRQVVAVAASFAFVNIYHGDSYNIRVWTALNAAQLLLEVAAGAVYKARVRHWLNQYLSPSNHQRIVAFAISCNLTLTSCYMFVFHLGSTTGFLLLAETFKPLVLERPMWHLLLLFYLSYCGVQASLRYESSDRCKQKRS